MPIITLDVARCAICNITVYPDRHFRQNYYNELFLELFLYLFHSKQVKRHFLFNAN